MTTLLVLLLQSTALLTLGLVAVRLARRRGPSVQTLFGRASLAGVGVLLLLAPLSRHIRPVVGVNLPPKLRFDPSRSGKGENGKDKESAEVRIAGIGALGSPSEDTPVSAAVPVSDPGAARPETTDRPEGAASSAPTAHAPTAFIARALPSKTPDPSRSHPSRFGRGRSGASGVGSISFVLLFWLLVCQIHLLRLRRTAKPIAADSPAGVQLAALMPYPPALFTHPAVHSPFLAGLFRPAILLPLDYETAFPPDALRAIFVHELTHRDRRDNHWTLAARCLCAALWFQPLLWLLVRQMERVSEDACDEAVLAAGCQPRAYADCLLSLAVHPPLGYSQRSLAAGVAPYRSSVGRRIRRILDRKGVPAMTPLTLRLRLLAAALTVAAALGGAFLVSSAPAQTPTPAPRTPTPQESQYSAEYKQDLQNLKDIGQAINKYIPKHHYRLPDANQWADQIGPYLQHQDSLFDPFQPAQRRYGYAYNKNCSGKSLLLTASPSETVIVFDSTLGVRNANDIGRSVRANALPFQTPSIGSGYCFVDGHAKWFRSGVRPAFLLKGGEPTAAPLSYAQDTRLAELKRLTAQLEQVQARLHRAPGEVSAGQTEEAQARFLAGLTPAQGPGVVVTLNDSKKPFPGSLPAGMPPPNLIHDVDLNQLVNELKAAGAEAIAVNGQRLVATSAIRQAGPTVYVNNVPQAAPYAIQAIGDPKALTAALTLHGGIASQIKAFDPAMFSVREAVTLTLPAYTGGGEMRYARPVGQ